MRVSISPCSIESEFRVVAYGGSTKFPHTRVDQRVSVGKDFSRFLETCAGRLEAKRVLSSSLSIFSSRQSRRISADSNRARFCRASFSASERVSSGQIDVADRAIVDRSIAISASGSVQFAGDLMN